MYAKLALSLAVSALILAIGGFFAVLSRLDDLKASQRSTQAEAPGRPPTVIAADPDGDLGGERGDERPPGDRADPLAVKDPLVKLDHLIRAVGEIDESAYEYYMDIGQDLFEIKREIRQLKNTLRQVVQGLGKGPGVFAKFGWGLAPRGAPIDEATAKRYMESVEKFGIQVEDGVVRIKGFLNFSPNVEMPIEYFITRFPQAGHETLVHIIGNATLAQLEEDPYGTLKGVSTSLYKAMVVAGFRQGEPTHPDPASDPKSPRWILASGDTVYVAVKYEREGKTHVALATDWVLDPRAESVLPIDAFRFTGSARGEDPDTGDEILGAEMMGLIASVWPNAAALMEVALESSLRNDYTYNFSRIPKHEGEEPLYLEVILSKTPIEPEGEGALPIERPSNIGAGGPGGTGEAR